MKVSAVIQTAQTQIISKKVKQTHIDDVTPILVVKDYAPRSGGLCWCNQA